MMDDMRVKNVELAAGLIQAAHEHVGNMASIPGIDPRAIATVKTKLDEARLWLGEAFKC